MKIINGQPMTTRQQAKMHIENGDYKKALKLAKAWKEDPDADAMVRGYECMTNPNFYESIGYNVEESIEVAKSIICNKAKMW